MKVAFITRSTLFSVPGGDTVQISKTAAELGVLGVEVDIIPTHETVNYGSYDLFQFFNITRPADILAHIRYIKKPIALSPILVDYSEFDRFHRKGLPGILLKKFTAPRQEYIKSVSRWLAGKDRMRSPSYLWKGQLKTMREILRNTSMLLPNSAMEYAAVTRLTNHPQPYQLVPNGIDPVLFTIKPGIPRNNKLVLCAARIEGIKNQRNLIRALNNTDYELIIIGSAAPNQQRYFNECRKIAASNVQFCDRVSPEVLVDYYQSAKVHVLPSWFETCGLSSLEAAAMGCNIVITAKGYSKEYFGEDAFYCDPNDPESIFNAIDQAAKSSSNTVLQENIHLNYTWQRAAQHTLEAYKQLIPQ